MRPKCTKMNWKIFAICVVGLLNCAFRQRPRPADSGRIQGTVCELDGYSPIKGARVTIEPTNSVGLKRIVTADDAGGFQFSDLAAGRYVLEAEAKDFIAVAALPLIAIGDGGRAEDVKSSCALLGVFRGKLLMRITSRWRSHRLRRHRFPLAFVQRPLPTITENFESPDLRPVNNCAFCD